MSTRSVVRIKKSHVNEYGKNKNFKIDLYHHHDGYIEGVGFDLFNRFYDKENKKINIPSDIMKVADILIKDNQDEYMVTPYNHCDIEYFYEININNKTITAWSVNNWEKSMVKLRKFTHNDILKKYLKIEV